MAEGRRQPVILWPKSTYLVRWRISLLRYTFSLLRWRISLISTRLEPNFGSIVSLLIYAIDKSGARAGFFTGRVDDVGPKPTIAGYTDRDDLETLKL